MNETAATTLPERTFYLVMLPMGPTIWAAHFFVTYVIVSLWCAPTLGGGPLAAAGPARPACAVASRRIERVAGRRLSDAASLAARGCWAALPGDRPQVS